MNGGIKILYLVKIQSYAEFPGHCGDSQTLKELEKILGVISWDCMAASVGCARGGLQWR